MIYRITGFLLLIETAMLLCCGGVSLLYHEDDLISFLQSASLTALMGVVLLFIGRGAGETIGTPRRICHRYCCLAGFLSFRNAPLLSERLYPFDHKCFFRNHVRFQQYRSHYIKRYRKTPPRFALLA